VRVLAIIIVSAHVRASGAVNAAVLLSKQLREYCDITVVKLAENDGETSVLGMPVTDVASILPVEPVVSRLPRKVKSALYTSRASQLIDPARFDLVHLHNPVPALELKRLAATCRRRKMPFVFSTHGLVEVASGGKGYGLSMLERLAWRYMIDQPVRWTIEHADFVMALSEADLPILSEYGCDRSRVGIVPNGVEFTNEPVPAETRERVAGKYGIPWPAEAGTPVCLYMGTHARNKGLPVLLQALEHTERPFTLVVGGGKSTHIDYDAVVRRCRPGQRIVFTGFVDQNDVPTLYALADLFIFPTLSDTFPLVVLEAMAHGVPVLSTRVGGIPYQVNDTCGRLVAPGDPVALRQAFEQMTADRATLRQLGETAARRAAAEFSWNESAKKAYGYYRQLLAPQSPAVSRTEGDFAAAGSAR
jgi:alpha-maltose-1-phosphate synthase